MEKKPFHILVINPGSTSTKVAVYDGDKRTMKKSIPHSAEELKKYDGAFDQLPMRKRLVFDLLRQEGISLDFDATIGRGGLSKPVEGGVYTVDEDMLVATRACHHQHACDLGCFLAYEIAQETSGCPSYIADPGVVDELNDYARISGSPLMPRICIWHALNQRAIARRHATAMGTRYEDLNLIICHLGGGISIAAHDHGRAVDANNALDGEGPFSPERAGSLPASDLIRLCFSGKFTQDQLLQRIAGKAGLTAHLGSNDMLEIENRIFDGDERARLYTEAMIYHVAKNIAAESAVLYGKVDAILLTGGIANSKYITDLIRERVEHIAPIYIYPGEDELEALASNALMVLRGETEARSYADVNIEHQLHQEAAEALANA